MTDDLPTGATEPPTPATEAVQAAPSEKKHRKPKQAKVEPRLAVYFGKAAVPPTAFVRAVAEAGHASFTDADVAEAERLREAADPDLVRLLGLATQPKLPKPVARWLWPAVLKVIRTRVPGAAETIAIEVDAAFRRLHRELGDDLASEGTRARQSATVVLQLGLAWMVSQRNLDLAAALQVLGDTYARGDASVTRHAARSLSSGKVSDIERSVAISKLIGGQALEAASQRDQERLLRIEAEERLDGAKAHADELRRRVAELETEVADLKGQVSASRAELSDSRQHWGHDMIEVKTRQAALLREKVVPMLGDAVDALEIEPAQPKIALRRIRAVLASVKETEG